MTAALTQGDGVEIREFGTLRVKQCSTYKGRNPRTGEAVEVEPVHVNLIYRVVPQTTNPFGIA